MTRNRQEFSFLLTKEEKAIDVAHRETNLSKGLLKKIMRAGAFWARVPSVTTKRRGPPFRYRKESGVLPAKTRIEIFYDSHLLEGIPPIASELLNKQTWGIWYKPAGLLCGGSRYGDQFCITKQVLTQKKGAFLIHRLDREAQGILIIAYTSEAAGKISNLLQQGKIKKTYRAEVIGDVEATIGREGIIDIDLDGKKAQTKFKILDKTLTNELMQTTLELELITGRYHQIRRHLALSNHPIIGDPTYGDGNKNQEGLKLTSYALELHDPYSNEIISFSLGQNAQ